MKTAKFLYPLYILFFMSCKINDICNNNSTQKFKNISESIKYEEKSNISKNISDTTFVNLKSYSSNFIYDMKYATNDNFLNTNVYDCGECFLRLKTVQALVKANEMAMKIGYKIKLYDCYRPLDIQKKMWKVISNPIYVANPKNGSIHNKGGAVDLTLVDSKDNELDMGTKFDFFGIESSHDYQKFSDEIKSNRKLLLKIMHYSNFKSIQSEWWHYYFTGGKEYKISNFKWKCN